MKTFVLKRIATNEHGTWGVLIDRGQPFCLTLENPWLGNQANISCILEGAYDCHRVNSPRFGETFEITEVPERTHILFHKGNTDEDTHGCILLGEKFDYLGDKPAILNSGDAFKEFMTRLEGDEQFFLDIQWREG